MYSHSGTVSANHLSTKRSSSTMLKRESLAADRKKACADFSAQARRRDLRCTASCVVRLYACAAERGVVDGDFVDAAVVAWARTCSPTARRDRGPGCRGGGRAGAGRRSLEYAVYVEAQIGAVVGADYVVGRACCYGRCARCGWQITRRSGVVEREDELRSRPAFDVEQLAIPLGDEIP